MSAYLSADNSVLLAQLNEGIEELKRTNVAVKQNPPAKSGVSIKSMEQPRIGNIQKEVKKLDPCPKFTGKIPANCQVDPNWCHKVGSPLICTNPPGTTNQPPKNKMLPYLLIGGGLVALYLFTKK
jgi:hypothetical protein